MPATPALNSSARSRPRSSDAGNDPSKRRATRTNDVVRSSVFLIADDLLVDRGVEARALGLVGLGGHGRAIERTADAPVQALEARGALQRALDRRRVDQHAERIGDVTRSLHEATPRRIRT